MTGRAIWSTWSHDCYLYTLRQPSMKGLSSWVSWSLLIRNFTIKHTHNENLSLRRLICSSEWRSACMLLSSPSLQQQKLLKLVFHLHVSLEIKSHQFFFSADTNSMARQRRSHLNICDSLYQTTNSSSSQEVGGLLFGKVQAVHHDILAHDFLRLQANWWQTWICMNAKHADTPDCMRWHWPCVRFIQLSVLECSQDFDKHCVHICRPQGLCECTHISRPCCRTRM